MYLRKVHIENIRSITELDWEIPAGSEAGWHVVIGDNGSGKSTFLRAIALVLVGQNEATALRQNWNDWMRKAENQGHIEVGFYFDPSYDSQIMFVAGKPGSSKKRAFRLDFGRSKETGVVHLSEPQNLVNRGHPVWTNLSAGSGWFSAAYGPFRRFTGGDQESEKIFSANPRLAAHLSIFGENIALTESLKWLKELKFKQLEQKPEGESLDRVIAFVNQEGFLPHRARLTEISSDGVIFTDGDERQVPVEELSDGYRSMLSMTFELIRQMSVAYKPEHIFSPDDSSTIIAPGVVLIDEVDAHLHPTWQRRIGPWFRKHFPNIQFIVTTHSPLICQAAEHGTVWRLPQPGSGEKAEQVTGVALDRLIYGNVLDAYGTELFGKDVGRSDAGRERLQRLAELNVKELQAELSRPERKEQQTLRASAPTRSHEVPDRKKTKR